MVARRRPPGRSTLRSMRSLRTASSSTMRSLTSSRPGGRRRARRGRRRGRGGRRCARPTAPRTRCRARCGSSRARPPRGRALEALDLALDGLTDRLGQGVAQRLEPLAEALDGVRLAVVAQLLADGGQLLAQQELALALLHAVAHLGADALGELQLGQRLLDPPQHQLDAGADLDGLEQLDLALDRQVGPPARGVGEGGRVVEPLSISLMRRPPRCSNRARKVARQLGGGGADRGVGLGLGDGLGLHPEGVGGTDHAGARRWRGAGHGPRGPWCRTAAPRSTRSGRPRPRGRSVPSTRGTSSRRPPSAAAS